MPGGTFILIDTPNSREILRDLDQKKLRENFIIRVQSLKDISNLFKGISISEKAIKSRYSKYEDLQKFGPNPMGLKLTKMKSLAANSDYQLFERILSVQSDSMDCLEEEKEESNLSKEKQKQKTKKKNTARVDDPNPPITVGQETAKKRKEPPVVDLTEESDLIQQLKVKIMTKLKDEEFEVFVRTTNGDARIFEHVSVT